MKKMIIFDCDGVLRTFSWRGIYDAYCAIGKHFGIDFARSCPDIATMRAMYSHDWRSNLKLMGIHNTAHYPEVNEIFRKEYFATVEMFSWVPDISEKLACEHIITIYSNSSAESIRKSLGPAAENFAAILGYDEVENLKPAPDGIFQIINDFSVAAENTVIVGDSDADIKAGQGAFITTALVTWGAVNSPEEIDALQACKVLNHPDDLLSIF